MTSSTPGLYEVKPLSRKSKLIASDQQVGVPEAFNLMFHFFHEIIL